MPRIPDSFLEELRARLRVSEVVGQRVKLKKAGAEFKGLSPFHEEKTPSFTVNDQKQFWHDFSTGKHGDIFDFQMWASGGTFEHAVQTLAALAGLPMPGTTNRAVNGSGMANVQRAEQREPAPTGRRDIAATYDYADGDGGLLYQVCRVEWTDNGKRKKTFMQRRPAPDGLTGWVWGLAAGEFIQGRNGDWYIATDERREQWHDAVVRTFDDAVPHTLYRLPELLEERAQGDDARTIYIVEGEKDSDTMAAWGLLGITNSGGARHWAPHHAEMFRGLDVIILLDNDAAGRERGHLIGASLRGVAKRTRVLDWRLHWMHCPEKADITDWANFANGNADKLYSIVDKLPDWSPVRPESSFLAVPFNEIEKPSKEFEWLIKKIMTRGETSVWFGAPGCGKSFLLTSAALSIARGEDWMGFKVRKGLVIYQAGEGGLGLKKRLRAWKKENHVKHDDNLPFVLLPTQVNLYASENDVEKLIAEIKLWSAYYDIALELVVIDTFSAASPGADENLSKDVGPVLARCRRIATETGAHVALVHHTPKGGGSPRGWSGFTGNVENVIEVIRTDATDGEDMGDRTVMRDVREFVVRKQKDGEDGFGRKFVLKQVILGRDADDDLITSCVVQPINLAQAAVDYSGPVPKGYVDLPPNARSLMRALQDAIKVHGRRPPQGIKVPEATLAVTVGEWQEIRRQLLYVGTEDGDPDGKKLKARIKKQIERTYENGLWTEKQHLIGKDAEWIWRTDRKVHGIDPPPVDMGVDAAMLLAPGEDANGMADLLATASSRRYGDN